MVYVDPLKPCLPTKRWPWKTSCHLAADSVSELHRFAATIGLSHSWFQLKGGIRCHPHYDLTVRKRAKALSAGAEQITSRAMVVLLSGSQQ